jgi:hypothetical protein
MGVTTMPYACGVDTARRVTGARLVGVLGQWGHDLAPGVAERSWSRFCRTWNLQGALREHARNNRSWEKAVGAVDHYDASAAVSDVQAPKLPGTGLRGAPASFFADLWMAFERAG